MNQEKNMTNTIHEFIILPSYHNEHEMLFRRQSTLKFLINRRNSSVMSSQEHQSSAVYEDQLIDTEDSLNFAKFAKKKVEAKNLEEIGETDSNFEESVKFRFNKKDTVTDQMSEYEEIVEDIDEDDPITEYMLDDD